MIAFDTNAIIRMLIEDDEHQAKIIRELVVQVEGNSDQIIILSEVLIETVWVLESVYHCTRDEIARFLEAILGSSTFAFDNPSVIRTSISQFKRGGDFANFVIINQAKRLGAKKLISFDRKLQKEIQKYYDKRE
jgi:predicted nucleic-acid-binding protein